MFLFLKFKDSLPNVEVWKNNTSTFNTCILKFYISTELKIQGHFIQSRTSVAFWLINMKIIAAAFLQEPLKCCSVGGEEKRVFCFERGIDIFTLQSTSTKGEGQGKAASHIKPLFWARNRKKHIQQLEKLWEVRASTQEAHLSCGKGAHRHRRPPLLPLKVRHKVPKGTTVRSGAK